MLCCTQSDRSPGSKRGNACTYMEASCQGHHDVGGIMVQVWSSEARINTNATALILLVWERKVTPLGVITGASRPRGSPRLLS